MNASKPRIRTAKMAASTRALPWLAALVLVTGCSLAVLDPVWGG